MKVFKISLICKIVLALTISPAFGQYYGGGAAVKPHAHSGVGDGGRITNLTTLGSFKAETLIIKSSGTAARPSTGTITPIYYNTSLATLEIYNSSTSQWQRPLMINSSFSATGGTEIIQAGYKVHTLVNNDVLTVLGISNADVQMLICAGGGAGGGLVNSGSGGGAGGCITVSTITLTAGNYTAIVGTAGVFSAVTSGGNSTFYGYTAIGGGRGSDAGGLDCQSGGSGGGAGASGAGCVGVSSQGYAGGAAGGGYAGGGGAGGVGATGNGSTPAAAGPGIEWPAGSGTWYAQGGRSLVATAQVKAPIAGSANGGDGGIGGNAGGSGSSGIVRLRYPISVTGVTATANLTTIVSSVTISGPVGIGTTSVSAAISIQTPLGVRTTDYYALLISSGNQTRAFGIHNNGHFSIYGATTTLATCTNGAIVANSHDTAGGMIFSGANSSCGISFGSPFDTTPACFCTTKNAGNNGCQTSQISVSSVTFTPITGNYASADNVYYFCVGVH